MGDNPYDDDMSPEVMEKLQRLREEKRRRELEEEKRRDITIEYNKIQGSMCSGSNEFNALLYTLIKFIVYLALISYTTSVINGNYALKPCNEVGGQCLISTAQNKCIPISDQACSTVCGQDPNIPIGASDIGCTQSLDGTDTISCIQEFNRFCVDITTCSPSNGASMKTALTYVTAAIGVALGLDAIYIICLFFMKSLHISDFDRLVCMQKALAVYIKVWAFISQLAWLITISATAFLFYAYAAKNSPCEFAVTTSGQKYSLFDDSWLVGIAVLVVHIVLVCVGTHFRSRRPLRGQLYSASNDGDITVPVVLSCKTCRESSKPRWCRSCFIDSMSKENVVGCVCNCASCLVDSLCCMTLEIVGWAVEQLFTHRHFIGP